MGEPARPGSHPNPVWRLLLRKSRSPKQQVLPRDVNSRWGLTGVMVTSRVRNPGARSARPVGKVVLSGAAGDFFGFGGVFPVIYEF